MDELNLVVHMAGGSNGLEQKLRDKGLADLKKIAVLESADLAIDLEIDQEMAKKIISAAKATIKPKVKKVKAVGIEDIDPVFAAKKEHFRKKPLVKRYWKFVLPVVAVALIGFGLKQKG